jgi:late competence protein required for DNA uptake (superfamily II DNA/RNA helicase)
MAVFSEYEMASNSSSNEEEMAWDSSGSESEEVDYKNKFSFIAEPESDLLCMICLEVATDPWQHNKCGRLYCKECLKKYGRNKPCPNCRKEHPKYFNDNRS